MASGSYFRLAEELLDSLELDEVEAAELKEEDSAVDSWDNEVDSAGISELLDSKEEESVEEEAPPQEERASKKQGRSKDDRFINGSWKSAFIIPERTG